MNASAAIVVGVVLLVSMLIAALGADMPRPLNALPAEPADTHARPVDLESAA